jgi:hypothetical protein
VDEDASNLKCVGCDGGGFGCFGDDVDRIGDSNDWVLAHRHGAGES